MTNPRTVRSGKPIHVGIAADHGGFGLKEQRAGKLRTAGYEVVDFGNYRLDQNDDYPVTS